MYRRNLLAKKIGAFSALSPSELVCLQDLQSSPIHLKRGKEIGYEGQIEQAAHILAAGWACSFKLLPDGGRQIIAFPIAGDVVGLRSMLLRTSDHSFSALTDVTVYRVAVAQMKQLLAEHPHLGAGILWAISRDEAMVVEHLVGIGRRNPLERTAHFFLELYDRLQLVGLAANREFVCPLTQYLLADALGLSTIHVNRVLRQLRERKLMTFKLNKVVIHDPGKLKALAGYASAELREVGVA